MSDVVDYIVVGAGSAGCVVAARLSESSSNSVALLEAGGEDDSFWIRTPIGYGKLYDDPKYNWLYSSEPEVGLAGEPSYQPRGKVIGGTGSINGSVYQRAQREDFDHWRQLGNAGWGYDDVLPFFKKAENNERGPDESYGRGGPLQVTNSKRDELGEAFIEAAVQAGYSRNPHGFNGKIQEGFDYNQKTIYGGERWSTASAYLRPARGRKNLSVILHALATRVLFKDGAAIGVEYRQHGKIRQIMARREVILCGGAFNSPQLLQVSGVGPEALLRGLNIPVVANLPGVGENLQNHISISLKYGCTKPVTVNDLVNNPFRRIMAGILYLLFKKGPLATNANSAAGMIRTDPALEAPDVKLQLQLWNRAHTGKSKQRMGLDRRSSFTITMQLMHPDNRGSVRIKSPDSSVAPELRFNFLLSDSDKRAIVGGVRAVRKIMSSPAIVPYITEELPPGSKAATDEDVIQHFRQFSIPAHHPTSTCKMGIDEMAVVDERLRVRGVRNLRVADASIMPRTMAANPNATTIMIGEKASAMVLEDAKG